MTTKSTAFNYKDCEKIDGRKVDSVVDLTDAVKAAETVTYMELGSDAIQYVSEDGHVDCIYGDDLSRIISMHLLKDVDITTPPTDGDVYIYDGNKQKFVTFNLTQALGSIGDSITDLNSLINNLVAFGNINIYGDYTNANLRTSGVYTHDPTQTIPNDQYFS